MYRDDVCAVCGESLPPDHLYCREHAAVVDDLLHEIGERLPRLAEDLRRTAELISHIHVDTWDYLSEQRPESPEWPPLLKLVTNADGEDLDVDVDSDPGKITVTLHGSLETLLADLAGAVSTDSVAEMAAAARAADGAGATH